MLRLFFASVLWFFLVCKLLWLCNLTVSGRTLLLLVKAIIYFFSCYFVFFWKMSLTLNFFFNDFSKKNGLWNLLVAYKLTVFLSLIILKYNFITHYAYAYIYTYILIHICVRTWRANGPKGCALLIHFKLCCTSANASSLLLLWLLLFQCCALFNFTVDNFRFTPNKYENKYTQMHICFQQYTCQPLTFTLHIYTYTCWTRSAWKFPPCAIVYKNKKFSWFFIFFFLCSLFVWLSVTCQLVIFDGPLLYFMYVHTYIHTAECWCVYGFWLAVYAELVKYLNILICIISNKAFRCCFYLVFKNGCELYFHKCSLGGKWVCQNF